MAIVRFWDPMKELSSLQNRMNRVFEETFGSPLYRGEHAPAGLWNDGPSTVLERIVVPTGPQTLTVRLRDSGRKDGFDFEQEIRADLAAAQNFVIEFRADQGFVYH